MLMRISLALFFALTTLSTAFAAAPQAPTNAAVAVAGNVVTITWVAPSTGDTPASYIVEALLTPGGPIIESLPTTQTTLVVPNVPPGTYYVRVRAANADGTSAASNEVATVVPSGPAGCAVFPNAPQNLSGVTTGNLVALAWTAPTTGCAPTSYVIEAGSAPGLNDISQLETGNATPGVTVSAPPGVYYVRVRSRAGITVSGQSNEIVVTIGGPTCTLPTAPTALSAVINGANVTLSWTASGTPTGYVVDVGTTPGASDVGQFPVDAVTTFVGTASPGTYYVRVRAQDQCGASTPSNEVAVVVSATTTP